MNEGGEPEAAVFEQIYFKNRDKVFRLTLKLLGNISDAEDLTQQVFLHAHRHLDHFRWESAPFTWLYRIALNLCALHFRRKKGKSFISFFSSEKEGQTISLDPPAPDPSHDVTLERMELSDAVRKAVVSLKDKYRDVVVLRDFEFLPYEDIATVLGISVKAVSVRLIRARNQLESKLKKYV